MNLSLVTAAVPQHYYFWHVIACSSLVPAKFIEWAEAYAYFARCVYQLAGPAANYDALHIADALKYGMFERDDGCFVQLKL